MFRNKGHKCSLSSDLFEIYVAIISYTDYIFMPRINHPEPREAAEAPPHAEQSQSTQSDFIQRYFSNIFDIIGSTK